MSVEVFDRLAREYDGWFDRHLALYLAELETLRRLLPQGGIGVEIGAGSGRFGLPLGAAVGIEPSRAMAKIGLARGLPTVQAVGEHLPLRDGCFDWALLVTVICFVDDVPTLLRETGRVLKPGGRIVIGLIDLASPLGRLYESQRDANPFYRHARFYTAGEVIARLEQVGFREPTAYQAMIPLPDEPQQESIEVRPGHGEGGFVGIGAVWSPLRSQLSGNPGGFV
ncbi:MAG: hypothetical protein BWY52_00482 [Chloroflexi bacterium ADurb.Bin325]|nr:MAG: hypothetical protein BWY52_00482 [Chloroflexi bacterium ADurb.Bin325]